MTAIRIMGLADRYSSTLSLPTARQHDLAFDFPGDLTDDLRPSVRSPAASPVRPSSASRWFRRVWNSSPIARLPQPLVS